MSNNVEFVLHACVGSIKVGQRFFDGLLDNYRV